MNHKERARLDKKVKDIRDVVVDVAYKNKSSHVGSCLSCIEILVYLYYYKMKKNDIFILSKGHAALALYAILFDKGLLTMEELYEYPRRLGGHVPYVPEKGLMAATGSLGHGVGIAAGYAIANSDITVYCLCGDGEINEGSYQEVECLQANTSLLSNLRIIIDGNRWQGLKAADELEYDCCDVRVFDNYIDCTCEYPISYLTVKGDGIKRLSDTLESHYLNINEEDYAQYKADRVR